MFHEEGSEQAILISAHMLTITYMSNFLIHNDNSEQKFCIFIAIQLAAADFNAILPILTCILTIYVYNYYI